MITRRNFLRAMMATLAWSLIGPRGLREAGLGKMAPSALGASTKRDYWNSLPLYLTAKMNEARARRKAPFESLHTEALGRGRIQIVRGRIWDLLGGATQKPTANPNVSTKPRLVRAKWSPGRSLSARA